ncbi:MAG: hypothetical protein AAFQ65_04930 [Myxococcota bacterium]
MIENSVPAGVARSRLPEASSAVAETAQNNVSDQITSANRSRARFFDAWGTGDRHGDRGATTVDRQIAPSASPQNLPNAMQAGVGARLEAKSNARTAHQGGSAATRQLAR